MSDEAKTTPELDTSDINKKDKQDQDEALSQMSRVPRPISRSIAPPSRVSTSAFPATDVGAGPRTGSKDLRRGYSNPAFGDKEQQKDVSSRKRVSSPPSISRHSSGSMVDRRRRERLCEQQPPGGHDPSLAATMEAATTQRSAPETLTHEHSASVGQLTAMIFQEEVVTARGVSKEGSGRGGAQVQEEVVAVRETTEEGSRRSGAQVDVIDGPNERVARGSHFNRYYSVCESEGPDLPITGDCFSMMTERGRQVVAVVGCGDYGLALANRLELAGFHVLLVTRNTHNTRSRFAALGIPLPAVPVVTVSAPAVDATLTEPVPETNATGSGVLELVSYEEGLPRASVAIVTVPSRHYPTLPLQLMGRKVLVDVSNKEPNTRPEWTSNAEFLQRLVPSAVVVKSLNTLPLWALQQTEMTISKQNPTCGQQLWAVKVVQEILQQAGLPATRRSGLMKARALERAPLRFFPGCTVAFPMVLVVVTFFAFLTLFRNQLCDMLHGPPVWSTAAFDYFLIDNTLEVCGLSVLSLLTLTYFPGVLAGYLQLWRGTKYRAFPGFLDGWLKARKQLGLAALLLAALHATCALISTSDNADAILRQKDESWMRPTYLGIGAITLLVLSVQGLFSLPSLGERLSWSESQFVLSRLGWLAYLLATTHVILNQWQVLFEGNLKCHVLPQGSQVVLVPALATIGGKLVLLVPCIDNALTRIRQGYNRVPVSVV